MQKISHPSVLHAASYSPRPLPPRKSLSRVTGLEMDNLRLSMLKMTRTSSEPASPSEFLALLQVITRALMSLSVLQHRYNALVSAGEPIAQEIEEGLAALARELETVKAASLSSKGG